MTSHFINPENPFVFNELIYSNQPHFQYDGSALAASHRFVSVLAPSLGIFGACLVGYLALSQTTYHFRAFSRMILLCSITDVLYALCDLWTQARFQINKSGLAFSVTGPASLFSYQFQCHSMSAKSASQILGYLILPVQYIFRYQTLKRNSPPSLFQTFAYVFACLLVTFFSIWLCEQAFCANENSSHVDFGKFWYKELPIPTLIVAVKDYPPAYFQMVFFAVVAFSSYACVVVYARLTVMELRKQSVYMSSKTMAMQRQIGRALFAQSLAPLFTAILPMIFGYGSLELNIDLGYLNDLHFSFMGFYPFLNSLCTLYFIVNYRNYCLRLFFPCFYSQSKRLAPSTSVIVINQGSNSENLNRTPVSQCV